MNATTVNAAHATVVGVDVAKNVFQLAIANGDWKIIEKHRLTCPQFERWFANRQMIMEACGSAHHWARWLRSLGIEVKLLPAAHIRAYMKRNKTDAADAAALLEAVRASDIVPVRVKSIEQQALQALHRTRSLWMQTRTSRINALRGFCREFGIAIAQGSRVGVEQISRVLADPHSAVPSLIRGSLKPGSVRGPLCQRQRRYPLESRLGQCKHRVRGRVRRSGGDRRRPLECLFRTAQTRTPERAAHAH